MLKYFKRKKEFKMDIKCKNCGQMIDENDKYCKYCGYLIPQKEKEVPLSKIALDDKIQEAKATVYDEDIVDSAFWELSDISVKRVGDKQSLYSKSIMLTIVSILLGIVFCIGALVAKLLIPIPMVAFVCLLIFMFAMISAFGFAVERFYNTKGIKDLKDNEITVKKYGFKKPAEVLIDGHIFELVLDKQCPVCQGEIIGDLHIEKIEKKVVVVCNINRKHIFRIDEKAFLDALKNDQIAILDKKKN